MYCKKCGKQIENDAAFCNYCGTQITGKTTDDGDLSVSAPVQIKIKKKISAKTIVLIAILAILILIVSMFGVYKLKCSKYKENRNLVFSSWSMPGGEIITFDTYRTDGNNVVAYDVSEAHRLSGGISIFNTYYLCEYFDLSYTEETDDEIYIDNDYQLGQKHTLVLEIENNELYIDEISNREMIISDSNGRSLRLTRI